MRVLPTIADAEPSAWKSGELFHAADLLRDPALQLLLTRHKVPDLPSFAGRDFHLSLSFARWPEQESDVRDWIVRGLRAHPMLALHRVLTPRLWPTKSLETDIQHAADFYAPLAVLFRDIARAWLATRPCPLSKLMVECVHNKRSVKTKPCQHTDYSVLIAVGVSGAGKALPPSVQRGTYAILPAQSGGQAYVDTGFGGTGFWRGRGAARLTGREDLQGLPHSSPFFAENETPIAHARQHRMMLSVMLTLKD